MNKVVAIIFQICMALGFVSALSGQRFSCDGQLLIAMYDGVSTSLTRPVYIPFNPPFISPFIKYTNQNFDALGFNPKDNYIYSTQENTNSIYRLKKDNSFEIIGDVSIVDQLNSNAGDCTPDGLYMCHDYILNQILVFEVVDGFELINRIDLYWDPSSMNSGAFTTRLFDFAFDPNNPAIAYAHQGTFDDPSLSPDATKGLFLQINLDLDDPNLGMVTPIESGSPNLVSHMGSLLFSPESTLHGFGTFETGFIPNHDRLYSINSLNGEVSEILKSFPEAINSDGCACPYSFSFTCLVPLTGVFCNNAVGEFTLIIENNSFVELEDVVLTDTFPEGTIIEEISETFMGKVSNDFGIGNNILEISEMVIPPKSITEIKIKIRTIDALVGDTYNQAHLSNLPERFEGVFSSDQIGTSLLGDPSLYAICPRQLEDVTWEIESASDCIDANDAKITFSSDQFFEGQEFEISLRNKIGWETTITEVIVDSNKSITLDSISPGDYQLYSFRSLSENCSLALEDTTIIVEPPNDLVTLDAKVNSPICEGETLILDGAISPAGSIRWTGPRSFGSDIAFSTIEDTENNRSGEYKVVGTYGFCEQIDFFDVDIKSQINNSISGKSEYCVRDSLILAVESEDRLNHSWKTPIGLVREDSVLIIPNINNDGAGLYEVISTNGACYDTSNIEIQILPTPTLELDEVILSDFCEPIILSPEITGDTDVSYNWFPEEGLNCTDCPNPQIQPLVQSRYQLRIENSYLCSDSADVRIILNKDELLYAPNIFKLNSTSINNQFEIHPGCVVHYIHSLEIFDRWGNEAFSSQKDSPSDPIDIWDGFIQGSEGNDGVYIWFAKVELVDGSIEYLTGDITLLVD